MSKSIKLTKDPIWTLLRKVTIPASVGSLFQTFYNLVDTWFAGRISAEAIGAIAKSFPIYFTIIAVGVGLGAATNALIGNSIGEKKVRVASMYIAQSLIFALTVSIFVTLFGLNASNYLLGLLNQGGLIIIDNVLWHGEVADEKNNDKFTLNIREFNKFVSEDKRVEQIIIPLGDGMTVCRVL